METNNQTTTSTVQEHKAGISPFINRMAYGAFMLLAFYFFVFSEDKMNGVMQMGIALIFDPFDQTVPFQKRPMYQRVWLTLHLFIALGLFVYLLLQKI